MEVVLIREEGFQYSGGGIIYRQGPPARDRGRRVRGGAMSIMGGWEMKNSIQSEKILNILRNEFKGATNGQLLEIAGYLADAYQGISEATRENQGEDFGFDFLGEASARKGACDD